MIENFNTVRCGLSKRANDDLGIPPRYRKLTLENFEAGDEEIATACDTLARSLGLLLTGPCGVGKTHLAVALLLNWFADALMRSGAGMTESVRPKGQFVSTADLSLELAELGRRRESQFLRKYDDFDCLVLDDLGAELSGERSRHVFGALIDRRYRRMRRTLITTNLSLQDLGNLYDDRMASRIAGMCRVIKLDGEDRRIDREAEGQLLAGGE